MTNVSYTFLPRLLAKQYYQHLIKTEQNKDMTWIYVHVKESDRESFQNFFKRYRSKKKPVPTQPTEPAA